MTVRDRAYNVIKRLKKVWFEEYCDVQREIEIELEALQEENNKLLVQSVLARKPLEEALRYIQSAGQGGNCLVCGEEDTCTENCAVGKALKGK